MRRKITLFLAALGIAAVVGGGLYLLKDTGLVKLRSDQRDTPRREERLVLNLAAEAVRAEFVADTPGFVFGTDQGKAHYEEADFRYHGDAEGWISWRYEEEKTDCALLAGGRGAFRLTCFAWEEPVLELKGCAVEARGEGAALMRVYLNERLIGEEKLPRGREFFPVRFEIPAEGLIAGENLFLVEVEGSVEFTPPGMAFPLRLSACFLSAELHGVSGPGHSWQAVKGRGGAGGTDLVLPSGTELAFYLYPEGGERLRTGLLRRGGGIEASIWISTPDDPRTVIFEEALSGEKPKASVDLDLSLFGGKPCRIALRAGVMGRESPDRFLQWEAPRLVRMEAARDAEDKDEEAGITPNPWAGEKPGIAIILMDAASAFFFKPLDAEAKATPAAEAFAKDAVTFERAVTPAPYTLPSVGSIFTGMLPDRHGVVHHADPSGGNLKLSDEIPTLASELKRAGYATFGVVTNPNASGYYGYGKGFDRYEELFKDPRLWDEGVAPEAAVERAEALLEEKKGNVPFSPPFFLYLHLFQPHAPYKPPEVFVGRFADPGYKGPADGSRRVIDGFKERGEPPLGPEDFDQLRNLYKAHLAFVDDAVGRFLAWLKETDRYDDTMIVLCSDHGEAFGEHRSIEHGHHLYEESLRIPLMIKYPHNRCSGGRVKEVVSLTDLAPTLGAMGGVPRGRLDRDGMDVTEAIIDPVLLSDRTHLARSDVYKPSFSLRWRGYQFIHDSLNRREELYYVLNDPRQQVDLSESSPVLAGYLRERLCRLLCALSEEGAGEAVDLDEEFIRSVRELGYTGGKAAGGAPVSGCPLLRRRR